MKEQFATFLIVTAMLASLVSGCDRRTEETLPAKETAAMRPAAAHGAAPSGGALKFTAPAEWVSEKPTSSMRQAQYRLPRVQGDAEDAELVVFYFQGGGGGVQANIDRWIGQFTKADGSPANDTAKTSHKTSHGIPITIVDVSGTYVAGMGSMMTDSKSKPNFRMLGAVAESGSGPWFFKLTGPARTIGKWESGFQTFLDTIQ
jgi:hypothetical protein